MTESSIEAQKTRRDHRTPGQIEDLSGKITGFVLARVAEGRPGFPGHPKKTGRVALSRVAAALGLVAHELAHPVLARHIRTLAAYHGVESPRETTLAQALARIAATFAECPVPCRGKNVHLSAVRIATGIALHYLKSPECQALLRELESRNGKVVPIVDRADELKALAAYGDRLRRDGKGVPAKPGRSGPSATRVAWEIGISPDRFAHSHLSDALERLTAELGVEGAKPLSRDIERFTAFVDECVATREPVPAHRGRVGLRAVAARAGIAEHRIKNNAQMQRDLARWASEIGLEDK